MKRFLSVMLGVSLLFSVVAIKSYGLSESEISARSAVVMCASTGELLFEKNAYEKRSMASTTKIMTALLAIEECTPERQILVKESMLRVEGTSMGLLPGDTVTLRGLIYGMLLQSGNDAANVTAFALGGGLDEFALMMNKRAKQIGMKNTHFVTPSGLDAENHYSTAYDMALLGCEAVKNKEFLSVCSQKSARVSYGNPPYERTLYNHNRLLSSYEGALGIKTGFTKKSGRCLVSCAVKNGVMLVCVTLNAPDDWQDHGKLLDYGFSVCESVDAVYNTNGINIPIVGGKRSGVSVTCPGSRLFCSTESIETKCYVSHFLYAPVSKGDIVGHIKWIKNGKIIATAPLLAGEDVPLSDIKKKPPVYKRIFIYIKEKIND